MIVTTAEQKTIENLKCLADMFPEEQEVEATSRQILLESTETICEHIFKGDDSVTITKKEFAEVWPNLLEMLQYYRNMFKIFADESAQDDLVNYEFMLNIEMIESAYSFNPKGVFRNAQNIALKNTYNRVYSACMMFLGAMKILYPRFKPEAYYAQIEAQNKDDQWQPN